MNENNNDKTGITPETDPRQLTPEQLALLTGTTQPVNPENVTPEEEFDEEPSPIGDVTQLIEDDGEDDSTGTSDAGSNDSNNNPTPEQLALAIFEKYKAEWMKEKRERNRNDSKQSQKPKVEAEAFKPTFYCPESVFGAFASAARLKANQYEDATLSARFNAVMQLLMPFETSILDPMYVNFTVKFSDGEIMKLEDVFKAFGTFAYLIQPMVVTKSTVDGKTPYYGKNMLSGDVKRQIKVPYTYNHATHTLRRLFNAVTNMANGTAPTFETTIFKTIADVNLITEDGRLCINDSLPMTKRFAYKAEDWWEFDEMSMFTTSVWRKWAEEWVRKFTDKA